MSTKTFLKAVTPIIVGVIILSLIFNSPLILLIKLMAPINGALSSHISGVPEQLTLETPDLGNNVIIVFDKNWIPQIYADNEKDAYYAIGFIHAWFRLWQMDMQRRLASGRLSEIIGDAGVKYDILMRVVGLRRSAKAIVNWLKENNKQIYDLLDSYSKGVNYAIKKMISRGTLPLMFKLLEYEPEFWTPEDSIVWARYMSWTLTSFWQPLAYSYLTVELGSDDVNKLWPVHPYFQDNVTVVPGNGVINNKSINVDPYFLRNLNWFDKWATGLEFNSKQFAEKVKTAVISALDFMGELPKEIGSNNWAVAPSRSVNGKALLADDPHLHLGLPSLWYTLRIRVGNDLDVYGSTLPGIPLILIGHNKYISWGLTNTQIGVIDFYVEKTDPNNPNKYFYKGKWLEITQIPETIYVKGGDPVKILVNMTVHGPILTNKGSTISMKWTANAGFNNDNSGITREVLALYLVNKAKNIDEFLSALQYWDVPSQNFMYADIYGNIAVVEPGLFPIRKVETPSGEEILVVGSRSLLNGTGDFEWIGYIPYEDVPHSVNPDRGFLAAPNQMSIGPYYPYFILGAWWDPGARAQRIFMDLNSKEKHDIKDMMRYQSDTFDWYAYSILRDMINSIENKIDTESKTFIDILKNWNYRMDKENSAPTIWWAWFSVLQVNIYRDYLKSHGIKYKVYPTPATTVWMIKHPDEFKTIFGKDLKEVVLKSFEEMVNILKQNFGNNPSEWSWGKVHKLYLEHLSGLEQLSRGPYPEDGGSNILMNAPIPYDLNILSDPNYVSSGPSWRIVAEMDNSGGWPIVYGVYPGGQSENPATDHYDNFVSLWLSYKYFQIEYADNPEDHRDVTSIIILKAKR